MLPVSGLATMGPERNDTRLNLRQDRCVAMLLEVSGSPLAGGTMSDIEMWGHPGHLTHTGDSGD